jgi:ubiquinone/menaquinone biosynthesis C-methylase UbiE
LAQWFHTNEPKTLLDVATGGGNFIRTIQTVYHGFTSIHGIDSLSYAITTAKKNFVDDDRITFSQMNATDLTFEDASFDLVMLSNSLHHLTEPERVFQEMMRVVKPGGHLLFAEMIRNDLSIRQVGHLKLHHFAARIDRYFGETHGETYTEQEILDLLGGLPLVLEDHWRLQFEHSPVNSDDEITWLKNAVDKMLERVKDPLRKAEFTEEAEDIKAYLDRYGFDSATTLMVVMKR